MKRSRRRHMVGGVSIGLFFRSTRLPLRPAFSHHPTLSIRGQCRLLWSGVYRPVPANDAEDLVLMRRIEVLFMAWPFLGSRRLTAMLRAEGIAVNRKRVQRCAGLGPKPKTTPGHKIFP